MNTTSNEQSNDQVSLGNYKATLCMAIVVEASAGRLGRRDASSRFVSDLPSDGVQTYGRSNQISIV